MILTVGDYVLLVLGCTPLIYYLLVLYITARFFGNRKEKLGTDSGFTPPVSNLKPVRGLDPEAYENFASLCRQDYPEYELIFCTTDHTDPSVPVIQRLMAEFPERKIRLLYSAGSNAQIGFDGQGSAIRALGVQ